MADGTVKISTELDSQGVESSLSKLGDTVKSGLGTAVVASAAAAGAAAIKLGKEVVSAYADYEQLVGGVDTLFKDSSGKLQEYAATAYKTAGLSANEYMETTTSFSASLLASLGGDTEKAVSYADMAITDMSDNANKMGSDMSSIQNAYQGFAKQNYTMLDNLKLGYGGTKTEMERLLADAEAISGIHYDVSSYADVVDAIHVIQTEMGITGTTALEAEATISGSIGMLQGSFQNLLVGLGSADADMALLFQNVTDAFSSVVTNITPVIQNIISHLPAATSAVLEAVAGLVPTLLETVTELFSQMLTTILTLLPELATAAVDALLAIVSAIVENLPLLVEAATQLVITLATGIAAALPQLIPAAVEAVLTIVQGLVDSLPSLLDAGLQLIQALGEGIVGAIPLIVEALPAIIEGVVGFLTDSIPAIAQAGLDLFLSLLDAIPELLSALMDAIPDIINGVVEALSTGIPALIEAGIELLSAIVEDLPGIIAAITDALPEIVDAVVNAITELVPMLVECGIELFTALIEALPEIIDAIVGAIPEIIDAVITVLIESIPQIIEAGIELFIALIDALPEIIDTIVGAIPQIIDAVLEGLTRSYPEIIVAGVQLFVALIENLPEIIAVIITAVPQIVDSISEAFGGMLGAMANAGYNLITGLWQGINDAAGWLWGKIQGFCDGVMDKIKGFFGIHSPSTLVRDEIGKQIPAGAAAGIDDNAHMMVNSMDKAGEATLKTGREKTDAFHNIGSDWMGSLTDGANASAGMYAEAIDVAAKEGFDAAEKWIEEYGKRETEALKESQKAQEKAAKSKKDTKEKSAKDEVATAESTSKKIQAVDDIDLQSKVRMYLAIATSSEVSAQTRYNAERKYFETAQQLLNDYKKTHDLTAAEETEAYFEIAAAMEHNEGAKREALAASLSAAKAAVQERQDLEYVSAEEIMGVWAEMRDRYAEGTKERAEADTEYFNAAKSYIEERKELEGATAGEVTAFWAAEAEKAVEGSNLKVQAEREYIKARQELASEIEAIEQQYADALENRTEQLANSFGLFEEVTSKVIEKQDLFKALESQNATLSQWTTDIGTLTQRGLDEGLIAELQQMGPKSADEVRAMTTMTDEELARYVQLWQDKQRMAREQAVKELEPLRAECDEKIQYALNSMISLIEGAIEPMEDGGRNISKGMARGILDGSIDVDSAIQQVIDSALASAQQAADAHSPARRFMPLGRNIDEGIAVGMEQAGYSEDSAEAIVEKAAKAMQDGLKSLDVGGFGEASMAIGLDASDLADLTTELSNVVNLADYRFRYAHEGNGGSTQQPTSITIEQHNTFNQVDSSVDEARFSRRIAQDTERELRGRGVVL